MLGAAGVEVDRREDELSLDAWRRSASNDVVHARAAL